MKQDESDGDSEFIVTIELGGKSANYWKINKRQSWNGEEYVGLIKTPYQDLMLDKWILRTKERFMGHKLFLPQEMVWHEMWIGGLQKKHNYRWWSSHKKI